jgi:hypothetical protein
MDPAFYHPNRRTRQATWNIEKEEVCDDFDGVEMSAPASTGFEGVEMHAPAAVRRSTRAQNKDDDDELPSLKLLDESGRRLSGSNASRYYAAKRAEREKEREKLRIEQSTPKAIENMLKTARQQRQSRRKGPVGNLPNPIAAARSFVANPVTRFWLACNLCLLLVLFAGSVLFLSLVYPVALRPAVKY